MILIEQIPHYHLENVKTAFKDQGLDFEEHLPECSLEVDIRTGQHYIKYHLLLICIYRLNYWFWHAMPWKHSDTMEAGLA
ncbi:hypothetical protein GWK08_17560 [Leptobacterium flavescens]|uniref:Uncharacterized protein n=1 Tax=Leptobacterium flavescens TaxID=472055 RepID=A0A6P0UTD2_9FLAO|nr:hypothetical protein [Leptobacterium flavescens]NER15268.1 hypothetical protein [Leptobacterium flavescens]